MILRLGYTDSAIHGVLEPRILTSTFRVRSLVRYPSDKANFIGYYLTLCKCISVHHHNE